MPPRTSLKRAGSRLGKKASLERRSEDIYRDCKGYLSEGIAWNHGVLGKRQAAQGLDGEAMQAPLA